MLHLKGNKHLTNYNIISLHTSLLEAAGLPAFEGETEGEESVCVSARSFANAAFSCFSFTLHPSVSTERIPSVPNDDP